MDKVAPTVANPLGYRHDKKKGFQAVAPQTVCAAQSGNTETERVRDALGGGARRSLITNEGDLVPVASRVLHGACLSFNSVYVENVCHITARDR